MISLFYIVNVYYKTIKVVIKTKCVYITDETENFVFLSRLNYY